jgi:coenzyme F420-reducing hydrogenase alpha subunit
MHTDFAINIENLSKIEGSADLDIMVRKGRVQHVKLKISENKRFYTQAIRGKPFAITPQLMSRICGTCSIAHLLCCIDAIENTLGVEPSEQTIMLRKLAMYGLMIRDHALHLYMFSLPDVFGKDSILEFDENNPEENKLVHEAFAVKDAGSSLSKLIAGRAVHGTYPVVGGFLHFPEKKEIKRTFNKLKDVRKKVLNLIDVFHRCDFSFEKKSNFVALVTDDYSFLRGTIQTTKGGLVEKNDYLGHLHRVVIPYSQASGYEFEGKEYIVGALARMNLNRHNLHKNTKKDTSEVLKKFPSINICHNNLAQAIEVLHCIDHSIELLKANKFKQEIPAAIPEISSEKENVGVLEAPRGTLYYKVKIGTDSKIMHGDIVVPTSQNQVHMENSIRLLVETNIEKGKEWLQREIEKLIRAYDPCMSCATHFLRINWI